MSEKTAEITEILAILSESLKTIPKNQLKDFLKLRSLKNLFLQSIKTALQEEKDVSGRIKQVLEEFSLEDGDKELLAESGTILLNNLIDAFVNPNVKIGIEVISETAKIPAYKTTFATGMDLSLPEEVSIEPHAVRTIPLGFKLDIPVGYGFQVRPRSGLSSKTYLRLPNSPGTIDSDFKDEVCIIAENTGDSVITFKEGSRIAQLVLERVPIASFYKATNIGEGAINRGGGFGHTGV